MGLAIGTKLTPQQRLHKALSDLMGMDEFIALSGVLMVGNKSISDTVSTAVRMEETNTTAKTS